MRSRAVVSFTIAVCGLAFTTALVAAANQSTATVVTTRDGREIKGTTVTEDTFVVHIRDDSGQIHVFDKVTRTVVVVPAAGISYERLVNAGAEPHNWLMYWGDFQGTHYSALKQITTANVGRMQAAWTLPMPGAAPLQVTPIVVDGVMYTTQPGAVVALDARTGRQIWRYDAAAEGARIRTRSIRSTAASPCSDHRLFVGTLDAALVALDARTGVPLWETQVADTMLGYSLTSAPLVVKDKVHRRRHRRRIRRARIPRCLRRRDRQAAVAVVLRARAWRIRQRHLAGRQLEAGRQPDVADRLVRSRAESRLLDRRQSGTADRSIRSRGSRQPVQRFGRRDRCRHRAAQVALPVHAERRPRLGFVPGRRSSSIASGAARCGSCCCTPIATGIFYVLDRTNGEFLSATPFVYANWTTGFDAKGRPIMVPGSNSSREGSFFVYPDARWRHEFSGAVVQPADRLVVSAVPRRRPAIRQRAADVRSGQAVHRQRSEQRSGDVGPKPGEPGRSAGIKALDPETGKTMWDFKIFQRSLADRRARHRRQGACSAPCATAISSRSTRGAASICGTSRPAPTWPPRR